MLKIDRVEITGFKSFSDKTEVRLPRGITAVVGPNGCGKSNIGDAIHWALGEQSAKTLRGGKMEDVIFSGTEARGPHGMAEVSLHLVSDNGDLHAEAARAIITRRLFRSGESEYLVDGKRSRLKDIHELLQTAHVGAATYAVIEQGKVDAILGAKPRERRQLIEEAAGIIGYKQKRHLAELKLLATEANLQRVHDVILEVRRQINSLKRQAARARRYSRLRDEMRALERRLIAARARGLEQQALQSREALASAQALEAETAAALARVEAELEAQRQARQGLEDAMAAARDALHQLGREIDRHEGVARSEAERADEARTETRRLEAEDADLVLRQEAHAAELATGRAVLAGLESEIAQLEAELAAMARTEAGLRGESEALSAEIERGRGEQLGGAARLAELSNTVAHLDKERARLEARRARLGEERAVAEQEAANAAGRADGARTEAEATASARAETAARVERARRQMRESDEAFALAAEAASRGREDLARLEERVSALEDVEARLAGIGAGARYLLTRGESAGVRGLVADFITVDPKAEQAVEGYLGPFLAAVVVPTSASAMAMIGDLTTSQSGRCLFVPEETPAGSEAQLAMSPELAREPAVLGALSEQAATSNGIGGVLARRLAGAVLARDLASAIDLARRYPGRDYITPTGEVVSRDGIIEGGRGTTSEDGLLARRRHLESTRTARDGARSALAGAEETRRQAETMRGTRAVQLEMADKELKEAERAETLALERAGTLADDRARETRRVDLLVQEEGITAADHTAVEEQIGRERSERENLESSLAGLDVRIQSVRENQARLHLASSEIQAKLAERSQQRAAVRERLGHMAGEVGRLGSALAELETRIAQGRARRSELETRIASSEEMALEARRLLAGAVARQHDAAGVLKEAEEQRRLFDEGSASLEDQARQSRAGLDRAREARAAAETSVTLAESEIRHLDERAQTDLNEPLTAILEKTPEEPEADLGVLDEEVREMRTRLDAMGPVNLLAIQEFRELEERHGFLSAQETDLQQSMESLRETIRRINRNSRERFLEAFELVRSHFAETFKLLFGGGRADIRLMEDEDPLECGLEITVQPPGKKLQSLSLLSGGEKALSAIALLFAIFRYQPSPFCLLDEVDAALDEANVRRFTRMLKEFSGETQFIVITHNKRSMEAADTLYGVTMEEPGVSRLVSMILADGRPVRAA